MVGRFLLGMVSGGLLVTGGLVVGSMLFPTGPANENAPVADVAEPIATPEATTPEAGETAGTKAADAVTAEDQTPAPEAAAEPTAVAETEAKPAEEPVVVPTEPAPEAPKADVAVAEPVAPAVAEVEKPAIAAEPSKPATGEADAAATAPEPVAPAVVAAPETKMAEVATAPAEPAIAKPVPAKKAIPAEDAAPVVAEPAADPVTPPPAEPTAEPAPVELAQNDDAPATEPPADAAAPEVAATPTTEAAPAVTEPAAEAPAAQAPAEAAPVEEATPDVAPEKVAEAPAAEAPAVEPPAAETPAVEAPVAEVPVADPAAEAPADPMPADPMPAEPEAEAAPDAAVTEMPGTKPDALPGTAEDTEADPPATEETEDSPTFKPAPGLIRSGEGVIIGRGTDDATEAAPADGTAPVDPRPIAQFAATFENPDAKPAFAIVLVDDGSPDLDRAGLAALPFPVSFALDPLDPGTPERAAIYRAAGREVVMLVTGIADGAQASDVEVAFQSMEQGLPEAVAVMDLADPTFQNNRGLAGAVVPILKAEGRGLLTWDEGLNAADQVARREDLEAAVLFRDLDQAGGDPVAVRRLLDRAVFKAGQDGVVSVVAKADPATVAALLEWTVEGKAATVALAPLTAVLKID